MQVSMGENQASFGHKWKTKHRTSALVNSRKYHTQRLSFLISLSSRIVIPFHEVGFLYPFTLKPDDVEIFPHLSLHHPFLVAATGTLLAFLPKG